MLLQTNNCAQLTMIHGHRFVLGFVVTVVVCLTTSIRGESSTCLMVYKEGGAPAVFQSPKCPRWNLPSHGSQRRSPAGRCQSAVHQGRRKSQEDRILCALDVRIPFPGPNEITETTVGIVAVFDGHNGAEASEMASKLLLEYFTLHAYFLLDSTFSILSKNSMGMLPSNGEKDHVIQMLRWDEELGRHVLDIGRFRFTLSAVFDESFHLEILKESLLRAIDDIDATFSKEASRNNFKSGSTATVVLIADSQILVANIGDSKAFLCSEMFQSPSEAKATLLRLYRKKRQDGATSRMKDYVDSNLAASDGLPHFSAKELTADHHPDRDEERSRVESAGGYVLQWGGVSRVNGQLAVSRAIGDVAFKSYGVISIPEVTDWQPLTTNDSYLVAASDGIFEKLSPQDVCDLFWELRSHVTLGSELSPSCSYSLAECIIDTAFERGTMDNMAAVVIPFEPFGLSQTLPRRRYDEGPPAPGLQYIDEHHELAHVHPVITKFDRLLVEGKQSSFGCFYLSENLDENDDYTFWLEKDDFDTSYHLQQALPDVLDHRCGGHLNLYSDQNMCYDFGSSSGGDRHQSIYPEGFASFIGFLGSIPVHSTESNHESNENQSPHSRYILKKRFGRGSYGEVWVAFHWNCSQGVNDSTWRPKNKTFPFNTLHLSNNEGRPQTNTSDDCGSGNPDDNMFILKRIMVERGNAVYLSGLREKHFGELFLNASTFLDGSSSIRVSNSYLKESESDLCDLLEMNESVAEGMKNPWSSRSTFLRREKQHTVAYEEGLDHIARYIESFESRSDEIWLVFRHEGMSLSKLLYTAEEIESSAGEASDEHIKRLQILHSSKWWHWLKTTEAGEEEMRNLIWQLLMALKSCHDRNITHRDIKPENMIICFEDLDSGRCLRGSPIGNENYATKMRIIDFGSALDEFTMKHLYGAVGPSRSEQTYEYMPPEAFLNSNWYQGPTSTIMKYDMWSVGVVILELILGSPDVFQINSKTRSLLDHHLEGWSDGLKELAYKLRSFMELCILIPGSSFKHQRTWAANEKISGSPASWKCSEEFFFNQIKSRDPLKIGFPNVWALRLVRQLLVWNPEDRLSVDDALQHPYFSQHSRR